MYKLFLLKFKCDKAIDETPAPDFGKWTAQAAVIRSGLPICVYDKADIVLR